MIYNNLSFKVIRFLFETSLFIYFLILTNSVFYYYYQINRSLMIPTSDEAHFKFAVAIIYLLLSPIFVVAHEIVSRGVGLYGWHHILIIFLTGYYTWFKLFPKIARTIIINLYKVLQIGYSLIIRR